MKRPAALAAGLALALLAGCHRSVAVSDTPDADADLREKTAAKTRADLAAADAAARTPLPHAVARPLSTPARKAASADTPPDTPEPAANGVD